MNPRKVLNCRRDTTSTSNGIISFAEILLCKTSESGTNVAEPPGSVANATERYATHCGDLLAPKGPNRWEIARVFSIRH